MTTTRSGGGLVYPDANTTPWPLNHHAYVRACADRLRKDLSDAPLLHFPECHMQRHEVRSARVSVGPSEGTRPLTLFWNELRGWTHRREGARVPLVLGAETLLSPETFAVAVTALLSPDPRVLLTVEDRSRYAAHPVDPFFERRLASYRRG
ncbi:hypothetical protein [Nocardiopsis lambiniae]|uniref:Uncharacterized protein n=1 Tax=Nocardiopsis lambiniae TaxID=3075539 RepID=A0ABU2M6V5_9ACTN|nr:hypothetical protein [Nocardiopsis sp. DSM 44743]MDT0328381.1 hypothetical protein [Nocardiopsis sp. DSM 44743]